MACSPLAAVLDVGRVVCGEKGKYKLTKRLGNGWGMASLFKAQKLETGNGLDTKWVVIKTRPAESRAALNTEYHEHARAGVSSCQFIRPLLDIIPGVDSGSAGMKNSGGGVVQAMGAGRVPQGLVFHWMERNLYGFDPEICRRDYVLPQAVATGVLQALVPFENNRRIHSDIKPDNILVNCLGPDNHEVKLSDLGEANDEGFSKTLSGPLLTRAPEVWEGKGYFHSSDIWALGVVLFERFSQDAFSFPVTRDDVLVDTIMLAKLMRLFLEWDPNPAGWVDVYGQSLGKTFADAKGIKNSIQISPLDHQLQQMDIPKEWKAFLRMLLTLDRNKRPSSSEALQSRVYQAILRNKVLV